jgi:Histidine kinase-, DNA gyrase B-, and HSP90-like ATPase
MPVDDMVRSALGQIEAYDRVDIGHLDLARLRGNAIGDLSHLLAELLENATQFSPPKSRVSVFGKQRLDGYLLVISDDGVGMTVGEFERVNNVLNNPAEFDTEATKVLGHIVVGRLALRHGVRVRVTESATTGVAAQILIPRSLIEDDVPVEVGPWVGANQPVETSSSFDPASARAVQREVLPQNVPGDSWSELVSAGNTGNSGQMGNVGNPGQMSETVNASNAGNIAVSPTADISTVSPPAPVFLSPGPSADSPSPAPLAAPESDTAALSTPGVFDPVGNAPSLGLPVRQPGLSPLQARAAQLSHPSLLNPAEARPVGSALSTDRQAGPGAPPPNGLLTQRVRGAQLPVTTLTPTVAAEPRDASAMRSALSSLQRGMEAAKAEPQLHNSQSTTPPISSAKDSL